MCAWKKETVDFKDFQEKKKENKNKDENERGITKFLSKYNLIGTGPPVVG